MGLIKSPVENSYHTTQLNRRAIRLEGNRLSVSANPKALQLENMSCVVFLKGHGFEPRRNGGNHG